MKNKQKTNWWIDFVLFIAFIMSFFFYLTGMTIHQWLGAFCILLAIYHLILHFKWVKSVGKRFFGNLSTKARINYALDFLLLMGFLLIGVSGLVISSWLNLPLTDFDALLNLHTFYSIATLVILLVKLILHLPWIIRIGRKIFIKPTREVENQLAVQTVENNPGHTSRRQFLIGLGVVGGASLFALASASKDLIDLNTGTKATVPENDGVQTPTAEEATSPSNEQVTVQTVIEEEAAAQPTQTAEKTTQAETTSEAIQPTSEVAISTEEDCTVRCPRGCAYPGHCRKYVDENNNGYCDLGECIAD